MKTRFLLIGLLLSIAGFSQPVDSVLIKGKIISKDNYPLPYANVRIANTDNQVFSDLSGNFEIWSPVEGILEFSCISEPYRISLNSLGIPKENERIKFKFDLKKKSHSNYKSDKLKGRTIKMKKTNQGQFSNLILVYYDSNFEPITQKHYDYHIQQKHKVIFMVDGQLMKENFTPNDLNYSSINKVVLLKILDSADKVIFMVSTKANR
jgi:hypothetical protein